MFKAKRDRGFTLVELTIYIGIFTLFMGMLYALFLPVLGIASASMAKVQSQSPAAAALYMLEADIRVSSSAAITVGTTPAAPQSALGASAETTAIAIPTSQKFSNASAYHGQYYYDPTTGGPLWQSYIVWALMANGDGTSTLYRTTVAMPAPVSGPTPTIDATTLARVLANIATTGRVMGQSITSLQLAAVSLAAPCSSCAAPKPNIAIEIAARAIDQHGQASVTAFNTQIFTRNN